MTASKTITSGRGSKRILLFAGCIACGLLWFTVVVFEALQQHALDRKASAATATDRTNYQPDIRHCFTPDVDLWDCIRGKDIE